MLRLHYDTPAEPYQRVVLANFDAFLQDHAANERKVSQSALTLAVQHPERRELCDAMVELCTEELRHFRAVYELLSERGQKLGSDVPDPYMGRLRRALRRTEVDDYLLDRLALFGIIEARGCERFALVAAALPPGPMRDFYDELVRSESRHHAVYLRLARAYFGDAVEPRLAELLDLEAATIRALPLRPALH